MKDLTLLLSEKLKQKNETKLQTLADKPLQAPSLGAFFKTSPLSELEEDALKEILVRNKLKKSSLEKDLKLLKTVTEEIKAIQSQAIILHGERIKRAQLLLKEYKEGAFTDWMLAVYGNRQTPYNFLQYYEFYLSLANGLKLKLLEMPKQAIYTLASRTGDPQKKEEIVKTYNGETKQALLARIRNTFPLPPSDKRKQIFSKQVVQTLTKLLEEMQSREWSPSKKEKENIYTLLQEIKKQLP